MHFKYAMEPNDIVESNAARKENKREKLSVTDVFRILYNPSSWCEIPGGDIYLQKFKYKSDECDMRSDEREAVKRVKKGA